MLGPIRAAWTSPDWLRHLLSPEAFYARFINITVSPDGRTEVRLQSYGTSDRKLTARTTRCACSRLS